MTGSQTSFGISVTDKRQHKDTKGLRRRSRLDQRTTSQLKQLKRRHSVSKGFIESYQQTERKKHTNNRQGFHLSAAEVQDSLKKPSEQNWELQLASIATSVLRMLMLSECTDTGGKKKDWSRQEVREPKLWREREGWIDLKRNRQNKNGSVCL